jgi:multidrug efflux pump subunit AcrB
MWQTQGRLSTPEQFGNIVLRTNPDGSLVRVRDVAQVELDTQNQDVEARINGQPTVAIRISLASGANTVETPIFCLSRMSANKINGMHRSSQLSGPVEDQRRCR